MKKKKLISLLLAATLAVSVSRDAVQRKSPLQTAGVRRRPRTRARLPVRKRAHQARRRAAKGYLSDG